MEQSKYLSSFTRRSFLGTLGAAGGAALLPGFTAKAEARSSPSPLRLKVGVLIPQSTVHPFLPSNLTAGMKLGFQRAGGAVVDLVVEEIGVASAAALDTSSKLIAKDNVDIVVGAANLHVAEKLSHMLELGSTYFIVADAGANVVRPSEAAPRVFYNSLGYWRANFAMGQWAAQHMGRKAFVASSFYESGYDALYAFQAGFERSGGEVVATRVTHVPPDEVVWPSVMSEIRKARPDFVFAQYCGSDGVEFVRAYAESGLRRSIPLAASPFLVDESFLPELGADAVGVKSCFTWASALANEENQAFVTGFHKLTGRDADAHALLGYDTARLIVEAFKRGSLKGLRVVSPRGWISMDGGAQSTLAPLYLREVRQTASGPRNEVVATINPVGESDERFDPLRSGVRTGWLHPYLGI